MEKQFVNYLEGIGIPLETSFKRHYRYLSIWKTEKEVKSVNDLLSEYPRTFFSLLITPESSTRRYSQQRVLESIKKSFEIPSEKFAFSLRVEGLTTIYDKRPNLDGIQNVLFQLYTLLNLQAYAILFFGEEVKKVVGYLDTGSSRIKDKFVSEIDQLQRRFVSFMNGFYWIRSDIRLYRARELLENYREKFGIEKQINILRERIEDISKVSMEMRERRTEKTLNIVILLFSIFSLAQVVTDLAIWYFGSLLAGEPMTLELFLKIATIPFILVIVLFLVIYGVIWRKRWL